MPNADPPTVRLVTDQERRARIGVRHALAGSSRVCSPDDAARSVVCLHATDPPSVHLSCWARSETVSIDDVERALYETRSLMRQQSMRETIFVFPRELVPAVWGSAAARVAAVSRKRLINDLERWRAVPEGEGAAWLQKVGQAVSSHLADGVPRSSKQLREEVPEVGGFIVQSPDKAWGGKVAIAPRVLATLSMEGVAARAGNAGAWYTSRPLWTTTEAWWGHNVPERPEARQGFAELIDRWLWSYGPGSVEDIAWWLGNTKTTVQTALTDLGAVPVSLEDGSLGWLREDDVEPVTAAEHWVALLPLLDPTVMGWKKRDFFLGEHGPQLFDSAGNAGTTVWVDGRVVGVWVQDDDGVVQLRLFEDLTRAARNALHAEAQRLTTWLNGQRVFAVYPSPAMQSRPDS